MTAGQLSSPAALPRWLRPDPVLAAKRTQSTSWACFSLWDSISLCRAYKVRNFQPPASTCFLFAGQWDIGWGGHIYHMLFAHLDSPCAHPHVETPTHPPHNSSSPGSAMGADNGPSLANSRAAIKLAAMRTAGFKEKCKMPFETKHTKSSQQRQQQRSGGSWSWRWGSLDAADGLAVPGRAGRIQPLSEGLWRLPTAKGLNGVKEIWAESLSHHKEVR